MTPNQAKKIIEAELNKRGLVFTKLTAKTVDFTDLARASRIFVTVHGWAANAAWDDLKKIANNNGFSITA